MPLSPAERQELHAQLCALADGERAAFAPLFTRLWPVVRGCVAARLPAGEAEDVAQQALLKVFARASEFDPARDALAWVLGVAIWEARTARRRRERRREDGLATSLEERSISGPSPEDSAIAQDLRAALEQVLGTLRPGDVEALRAFAEERRPRGAAFRKRLERALGRLRLAWGARHVD